MSNSKTMFYRQPIQYKYGKYNLDELLKYAKQKHVEFPDVLDSADIEK